MWNMDRYVGYGHICGIWTDMWNMEICGMETMENMKKKYPQTSLDFMQTMETEDYEKKSGKYVDYEKEVWQICSEARNINKHAILICSESRNINKHAILIRGGGGINN